MSFVDYPWRFAHVPQAEIRVAAVSEHGARRPAGVRHASARWIRRTGTRCSRPDRFSNGTRSTRISTSASRVRRGFCCCRRDTASYRGFFRLLSEQHIPFAVSENLSWIDDPSRAFDLVIAPGGAPAGARSLRARGGRLLLAGRRRHQRASRTRRRRPTATQGYWRVHDHATAALAEGHATSCSSTASTWSWRRSTARC